MSTGRTKVFVSYSHVDQEWRERLATHFAVLERKKLIDLWADTRLQIGDAWEKKIDEVLKDCQVAVLVVSPHFLASRFIQDVEMQTLLERHSADGLAILPVIARPCAWRLVEFLADLQARPQGGRALSLGTEPQIDQDLAMLTYELAELVGQLGPDLAGEMDTLSTPSVGTGPGKAPRSEVPSLAGRSWVGTYGPVGDIRNRTCRLSITAFDGDSFQGSMEWNALNVIQPETTTTVQGRVSVVPDPVSSSHGLWRDSLRSATQPWFGLTFTESEQRGTRIEEGAYRAILQRDWGLVGCWYRRGIEGALVGEFSLSLADNIRPGTKSGARTKSKPAAPRQSSASD